ncbi:hypothetical protein DMH04_54165 [Kibdelosporangium aridum]|uniref:Oxidoreductase n=1 Tax=Kibdelosporangium aridum TaxID=2030 RepID=A0A428XYH5_KIBAR|nr:hypothetical protein DMH04_54165 [Kibdelosporangium aridum]
MLIDVLTDERTISAGRRKAVRLRGVRVVGSLDLESATLLRPLLLQDCYFDQPLILHEANALAVRLLGCHLPGVAANQLRTRDDLDFTKTTINGGAVHLRGAHIGGGLWFTGSELHNPGGFAIFGNLLTVEHSMFCRNGFIARGEIRLRSASIGSQFSLNGASLSNPDKAALDGSRLHVGKDMFCKDRFTCEGELNLDGALVDGTLLLREATLRNAGGTAFSFRSGRARTMGFQLQEPPLGAVVLTNAQVEEFDDESETWPEVIWLRGFKYDTLRNETISVRSRLNWLTRHPDGFAPGTYDNLATAYKQAGQAEAARRVAIAKHWRRRRELKLPGKLWNWLLYLTVGYGYRTWLAGLWLAGLLLVGAAVFADAYPSDMLQASTTVPAFQPLAYSLDVLLPVVDLGQQRSWLPQRGAQVWSWAMTAAGWVLATAVIAGIGNVMRRE